MRIVSLFLLIYIYHVINQKRFLFGWRFQSARDRLGGVNSTFENFFYLVVDLCIEFSLSQLINRATRFSTILELILVTNESIVFNILVNLPFSSSDCNLIFFSLALKILQVGTLIMIIDISI